MKSIISKATMLVAIAAMLFSFSTKPAAALLFGGEGFEISLNGKLVLQKYGNSMNDLNSLQLNANSPNDKLVIKYHHCGRVGKDRVVTIKNVQDKTVKEWRFADSNEPLGPMSCSVKEILALKNAGNGALKLYYSSTELPKGRMLASIVVASNSVAKR